MQDNANKKQIIKQTTNKVVCFILCTFFNISPKMEPKDGKHNKRTIFLDMHCRDDISNSL